MNIYEQIGSFFGGEKEPKLTDEEIKARERLEKLKKLEGLENRVKEITGFGGGFNHREDNARYTELKDEIKELKRELEDPLKETA